MKILLLCAPCLPCLPYPLPIGQIKVDRLLVTTTVVVNSSVPVGSILLVSAIPLAYKCQKPDPTNQLPDQNYDATCRTCDGHSERASSSKNTWLGFHAVADEHRRKTPHSPIPPRTNQCQPPTSGKTLSTLPQSCL